MKISFRNFAIGGLVIVLVSLLSMTAYSICPSSTTAFDPNNMAGSGYVLVYDEEFGAGSIATDISFQAPANVTAGFKLYSSNLIGCGIKSPSTFSINGDGSLHDAGTNGGCGYDLSSIGYAPGKSNGPAPYQNGWIGTAFGQGFYQESAIKYVQACDSSTTGFAHPTIWGDSAEAETGPCPSCLVGTMVHFVELDAMEWTCGFAPNTAYFNNSVDWWQNQTHLIVVANNITVPAGTDLTNVFHVYGQLWVWGGPNGSCATGYRQQYFDSLPVGVKISWQDCDQVTVPPTGTNIGNAIDGEHLSTNIGTGVSTPTDYAWIRVWQLPSAAAASGNNAILVADVTPTAVSYNNSTHVFSSTIQNIGPVATPTSVHVSYLVDGVAQAAGTTTSIASGASSVVGSGAFTIPSGAHTITAYANDNSAFPEGNRTNNKLSVSITVP